jgi:hypothetical protein
MDTRMTAVALLAAAGLAAACGSVSNTQGTSAVQGHASPIAQVATSTSIPSTATAAASLATPATNPVARVSGTVAGIDGSKVTLKGGDAFTLTPQTTYNKREPITPSDIQPGSTVAVTAKRQPNNTLLASIVQVLPAARSSNFYGQSPLDGGNLMTNATVDKVSASSFTVTFPGGSEQVNLAPDAVIARIVSGAASDVKVGSTISASIRDGAAQSLSIQ